MTTAAHWIGSFHRSNNRFVAGDPQVFEPKFGLNTDTGETRPNGSYLSKEEVQTRAELRLTSEPFEAAAGVIFSGRIPHVTDFEKVPDYFVQKTDSGLVHDPIRDDRSLILDHPRGFNFGLRLLSFRSGEYNDLRPEFDEETALCCAGWDTPDWGRHGKDN